MSSPVPVSGPALVLYSPALNEIAGGPALDEVAQRIARTLDHHVEPVPVSYSTRAAAPESFGFGNLKAEVREILRHDADGDPVVTHRIYHLDYHGALDPAAAASAGGQVWSTFLQCCRLLLRFVGFVVRADALTGPQKTSLVVGGFCLSLIILYTLFVIAGLVYFVLSATGTIGDGATPSDLPGVLQPVYDGIEDLFDSQWVRVVAVLSVFGLSSAKLRSALETTVKTYLRFGRYIESASIRAACLGRFNDLLEHLLSQSSRVDIISYSMGSLVALDALFPIDGETARRATQVRTLTTIGCPFDLVRTFWPDYFARRAVPHSELKWLNVYSPVDVLGSNFANEGGIVSDWSAGINATATRHAAEPDALPSDAFLPAENLYYDAAGRKDLSWTDALLFHAFEAHSQYWVAGQPDAESCYKKFVPTVFAA